MTGDIPQISNYVTSNTTYGLGNLGQALTSTTSPFIGAVWNPLDTDHENLRRVIASQKAIICHLTKVDSHRVCETVRKEKSRPVGRLLMIVIAVSASSVASVAVALAPVGQHLLRLRSYPSVSASKLTYRRHRLAALLGAPLRAPAIAWLGRNSGHMVVAYCGGRRG